MWSVTVNHRDKSGSHDSSMPYTDAWLGNLGRLFAGGRGREGSNRAASVTFACHNVPTLSVAVHGYSHAPEMVSLSNALHLLLAGLSATPRFLHVPGKANLADIPSSVPFVCRDGSHALDPDRLSPADVRVVASICACYLPMVLPTAAQLGNPAYFILRGVG
jgi:hypothetical protein